MARSASAWVYLRSAKARSCHVRINTEWARHSCAPLSRYNWNLFICLHASSCFIPRPLFQHSSGNGHKNCTNCVPHQSHGPERWFRVSNLAHFVRTCISTNSKWIDSKLKNSAHERVWLGMHHSDFLGTSTEKTSLHPVESAYSISVDNETSSNGETVESHTVTIVVSWHLYCCTAMLASEKWHFYTSDSISADKRYSFSRQGGLHASRFAFRRNCSGSSFLSHRSRSGQKQSPSTLLRYDFVDEFLALVGSSILCRKSHHNGTYCWGEKTWNSP